jgi:hypothetical protein
MTDDEILAQLRACAPGRTPVEVAERLGQLWRDGLVEGALVMFFVRAFGVPLGVMRNAGGWKRVGDGIRGLSDEEFNELLRPYLPK